MSALIDRLSSTLADLRAAGTYKELRHLTKPMAPATHLEEVGDVLVFCANNYLGLADHPEVVAAGVEGLKKYGAGTASVRFICGTFDCHRQLEETLARFLGTESCLTYVSCWNANEGLFANLLDPGDAVLSDELNHASIIDALRLCKKDVVKKVYRHSNLEMLENQLREVAQSPVKIVATDGVFSMEGDIALLPELVQLCRRYGAALVVDDSHGVGVLGKTGRGVHEHFGIAAHQPEGIDFILTGTLGKALGGAAGGYVAGPKPVIDLLIQRSRPQLFSNALPPTVAMSARKAVEILESEPDRVRRLRDNVERMRSGLKKLGFHVLESPTAILPIIIGDTAKAIALSNQLLKMGVFVIGFGFPVVPEGAARLRVQMSAAHTADQIDRALAAFEALRQAAT